MRKMSEGDKIVYNFYGFVLSFVLFVVLCLTSCSSAWHIQRAIAKNPDLLERDTVVVRDTVSAFSERVEIDSVFMVSTDTVIIIKDNLTIRHFIRNDSVFIQGECDSVEIYIPYEVKVPFETIHYDKSSDIWKYLTLLLGGMVGAGLLIWFLLGKRQKLTATLKYETVDCEACKSERIATGHPVKKCPSCEGDGEVLRRI